MFGLFGGKKDDKKKKKEETQEEVMKAVEKLNLQLSDMEEKISHLEAKKNGIVEMAKEKLKKGDKTGARQALQKKKWVDEQIKTMDGAIMMLEEQKMMLDSNLTMGSIYESLKEGSKAMNLVQENFKIEDLDKIRDEMEDIKDTFNEKNEFFQQYAVQDNTELDDELDQLQSELDNEALPDIKDKKKEVIFQDGNKNVQNEVVKKNEEKDLEAFLDL